MTKPHKQPSRLRNWWQLAKPRGKFADQKVRCTLCGWSFTVHNVPNTEVYKRCLWCCPNCGQTVETADSLADLEREKESIKAGEASSHS